MSKKTTYKTVENLNRQFGISDQRASELLDLMEKSADKHDVATEEGAHAHIRDIFNFNGVTLTEKYYLFTTFGVGLGMAIESTEAFNSLIEISPN